MENQTVDNRMIVLKVPQTSIFEQIIPVRSIKSAENLLRILPQKCRVPQPRGATDFARLGNGKSPKRPSSTTRSAGARIGHPPPLRNTKSVSPRLFASSFYSRIAHITRNLHVHCLPPSSLIRYTGIHPQSDGLLPTSPRLCDIVPFNRAVRWRHET